VPESTIRRPCRAAGSSVHCKGDWQFAVEVVVVVQCDSNLLEIAFALSTPRSLASLLHRWQQQRNQDCDNGNDNEQLNQRKPLSFHVWIPSGGILESLTIEASTVDWPKRKAIELRLRLSCSAIVNQFSRRLATHRLRKNAEN
jgi:hypothetical protein